jgi:hypothetical protein
MPRAKWAPAEEERLRQLWTAGASQIDIAAKLGRSVASIWSKATLMRLPRRVLDGSTRGDHGSPSHDEDVWRAHSANACDEHLSDLRRHHAGTDADGFK